MEQIRQTPVGVLLLWIIALGLLALAIWQIAEAFLERDPDTKKKWGYRIKYVGTAIAYIAIAWTALVYALGGESDSSESSESFSAKLLATPGGVFLLVLVGLIVVAIGVAFIVRGVTRAFEKRLNLPAGVARPGIVTFGVVGYIAKGIAIAVTGVLFVVAAFTHDPEPPADWMPRSTPRGAALRRRHPLDRRRRARDLRRLLLRPRAVRQDVIAGADCKRAVAYGDRPLARPISVRRASIRGADGAGRDEFGRAIVIRRDSVAQLRFEQLGFFAADGLAAGDEPGDVGQRDLLEEEREDEGDADERQQVPEHRGQGVGVGVDDAVADRVGQLAQRLRARGSTSRSRHPLPTPRPA